MMVKLEAKSYEDLLKELFSLQKRQLRGDIMIYKYTRGSHMEVAADLFSSALEVE